MSFRPLLFIIILTGVISIGEANTPIYRLFEYEIENPNEYDNKFLDVTLKVQFQAPSGKLYDFYGFYDGDGEGNADGNVWKIRFMPDEVGEWKYVYSWSDGTTGGNGNLNCIVDGGGKGILKAYEKNPHWFAYNGTQPVWLKSYYETGHGSLGQDFNWIVDNVYNPLVDAGYNHLQVNWLLSLCCFEQYYKDGPEPETMDLSLYQEGDLFGTMNLEVWRKMEQHLGWLNDHDVGVHMFLGFDGSRNDGPAWEKLSSEEKDWYVKYAVARLAPFANIAGWNFVWEVPGDRESHELGFIRLIQKYDIFDHLRTYEDEMPRDNEYTRPEYTFAAVENHKIAAEDKEMERHLYKEPWTHHMACLLGYTGKPVFMSEGNALWRRYWQKRTNASLDELRRSAWACVTAGASFTWCGHAGEKELYASGPIGLPFNDANPYAISEKEISILSDIINNEVEFYKMVPNDKILANHPAMDVYALSETGSQYLVFSPKGNPFSLELEEGEYMANKWIDAKTGEESACQNIVINGDKESINFVPANQSTDWILIVKKF